MNSQVSKTITPGTGKKEGNKTLLEPFTTGTSFALLVPTTKGEGDSTKVEKEDKNKKNKGNDPLKPNEVLFEYTDSPEEGGEKEKNWIKSWTTDWTKV